MPEPKWHRELTPYQWRVLVCACLGWALDIMAGFDIGSWIPRPAIATIGSIYLLGLLVLWWARETKGQEPD
jgi:hypothetical protein